MKYIVLFSILLICGCMIRIEIQDNCDTVSGVDPDQVAEVITNLKETPEGDLVIPPEEITK